MAITTLLTSELTMMQFPIDGGLGRRNYRFSHHFFNHFFNHFFGTSPSLYWTLKPMISREIPTGDARYLSPINFHGFFNMAMVLIKVI